jgi:pullulanase
MNWAGLIRKHLVFSSEYQPGVASYMLVNHANGDEWKTILLVFNGNRHEISFKLQPQIHWRIVARDTTINTESTDFVSGSEIQVSGISMLMLVEDYFVHPMQFQ